jgi:hypothetical protein
LPHFPGLFEKYKGNKNTFIETGTHVGQGVLRALYAGFKHIYSCELEQGLIERALVNIQRDPKSATVDIVIYNIASSELLKQQQVSNCVLWLDAHWSGDGTAGLDRADPLEEELRILKAKNISNSIILMDDARGRHDLIIGWVKELWNKELTWEADSFDSRDIAVLEL